MSGHHPASIATKAKVAIVARFVPHYRVALFEALTARLSEEGIQLDVFYGDPGVEEALKCDARRLASGTYGRNLYFAKSRRALVWQPFLCRTLEHDLVIVEQATRLLLNYVLWIRSRGSRQVFAFWGHGRNFQAKWASSSSERLKAWMSRRVDWWFAYNERSSKEVVRLGFDRGRITVLNNSVDTLGLMNDLELITTRDTSSWREAVCGRAAARVGLFIGGLYEEKRLEFLIASAGVLKEHVPEFHLVIAGGGPGRRIVEDASSRYSWIHYLGPIFGREKALALASSHVFLMPGLVGLASIDCFASGLPIVTTAFQFHSPEIDYLVNGANSVIVAEYDSCHHYAKAAAGLLTNETLRLQLGSAALDSGKLYSLDAMVDRFASGIELALQAKGVAALRSRRKFRVAK